MYGRKAGHVFKAVKWKGNNRGQISEQLRIHCTVDFDHYLRFSPTRAVKLGSWIALDEENDSIFLISSDTFKQNFTRMPYWLIRFLDKIKL